MVSVNYTGQEIILVSPGGFYGGVNAENIARHEPRHRNKTLARILMTHNLVDRAGVGVARMGLHSLRYGRSFPQFRETSKNVEVRMEAKYLRAPITVLAEDNDDWGIPEFLIVNSVYETGVVPVGKLEPLLAKVAAEPWKVLVDAVGRIPEVSFCGTRDGVFVRVRPMWRKFFRVEKTFRPSTASEKYVKLYSYLKKHGDGTNADLTDLLSHRDSSQTSKFLRNAKYVQRHGSGRTARWSLREAG